MRHQTKNVPFPATNARDICARAIRISTISDVAVLITVAENNPVFTLEFVKCLVVANVIPLGMRNRKTQDGATFKFIRKGTISCFRAHENMFANEMKTAIANQGAGQQSSLTKDLKAVTNAEHESAALGKLLERIHHRREAGQRSCPQVVAVRESAGNDHRVIAAQICVAVPDKINGLPHVFRDHMVSIMVTI